MNILHLSPFVPDVHANHAGGVCMGKQVETLKKNHNVTVLTFLNSEHEEKLLKNHPDYLYVRTSKWTFIANVLLHPTLPAMFAVRCSKTYRNMVRKIILEKHIDAVHAEYTSMGQYNWIKQEFPNIQFNMTEHDVALQSYRRQYEEASGLKKLYMKWERDKVEKCERQYLHQADNVMTFNDKDARLLNEIYNADHVKVINPYYGVDFDQQTEDEKIPNSICFVGQMGRDENHIAAMRLIKIFNCIDDPSMRLTIIGAYPKDELLQCESERIHVTGFVDDINEEIRKHEIAVFPLTYGAGIKLKVLLAFGLGLPVVTSAVGAEGIDSEGKVLKLAETDDEFKQAIHDLLSDRDALHKRSLESKEYVRENFGWDKTAKVFAEIYQND